MTALESSNGRQQDAMTDEPAPRLPGNHQVPVIINHSASYIITSFNNPLLRVPVNNPTDNHQSNEEHTQSELSLIPALTLLDFWKVK